MSPNKPDKKNQEKAQEILKNCKDVRNNTWFFPSFLLALRLILISRVVSWKNFHRPDVKDCQCDQKKEAIFIHDKQPVSNSLMQLSLIQFINWKEGESQWTAGFILVILNTGVYILASQKNSSPLEIITVFFYVDITNF